MTRIETKRVVTYQSDGVFRVSIGSMTVEGQPAYEVAAKFKGQIVGNIFIERYEDLKMLADALNEFVEVVDQVKGGGVCQP